MRLTLCDLRRASTAFAVLVFVCSLASTAAAWQEAKPKAEAKPTAEEKPAASQDELEKKFIAEMSGVVFDGSFTVERNGKVSEPSHERYSITKVEKVGKDLYQFNARVQYGGKDVTVPLRLNVFWAGDTPVISLTKLSLPLLGTYSARVVVYDGQYAGTWSASDHGGHLWGKLEKLADAEKKPTK